MPPFLFFSKNFLIGEFSPKGSKSSILVFCNEINAVFTPCFGSSKILEILHIKCIFII